MTALKWSMEAVWAAVAVVSSVAGGFYTTVYHSGANANQIVQIKQHQDAQDQKIDATAQALAEQKVHDSAVEQKLSDVKDQLDRIERKL